ncbi:ABC transporter ATP-binding protein [Fusibacter sp. 3D3]|uniref:ABC transporter ATP-binding protein n=1 Tax=Fusibacter sp. 3D3 TaxID=1048380 RepID=UPI000853BE11|nr:ABC transporter ATP-binding protein [Fusibacter sp. 3D3]GAU76545.1 nickel transport ATP-binding protein NikD [Fusibacter sp. 3D3]
MNEPLLEVKALQINLKQKNKHQQIIKGVKFELFKGECLGILGESGSGKSLTMKSIVGILDASFSVEGEILFKGDDLMKMSQNELRKIRGCKIAMIMQQPMACFDPLIKIGAQIRETLHAHLTLKKEAMHAKCLSILEYMCIQNPEEVLQKYPHQLSGGMLQRIMIGLALALEPDIIIADEPTTAIDAITQYEIIKEFQKIKQRGGTSLLFVSHDLGVIENVADRVLVMNQGCVVDQGSLQEIVEHADDAYTRQLIKTRSCVRQKYLEALKERSPE